MMVSYSKVIFHVLSKYRVCLQAEATVHVPTPFFLFFCFHCKHIAFDTHVRYSHCFAIFQTTVPSFLTNPPFPLSLYYSLPSTFGFVFPPCSLICFWAW